MNSILIPFFPLRRRSLVLAFAVVARTAAAADINVAGPAYGGTGICGVVNSASLGTLGTSVVHNGTLANINDNDPVTRVDTFGSTVGTNSYAGILWPFRRADSVKSVKFTMFVFSDGGWFGFTGATPGPGNQLNSISHLLEPRLQATTDGGVTWTAVDGSSPDFFTVFENFAIPIAGGAPLSGTFEMKLDTPLSGINGIRVIGENGGTADTNGFLGIGEVVVTAGAVVDTDGDGMEDSWEEAHGGKALLAAAPADTDVDGLPDYLEFLANSNPQSTDSDGDGLTDGVEVNTWHTNPTAADTDGDGLADGAEVNTHLTNPALADSDGDGLTDGAEINTHLTTPTDADTDDDGFSDGQEVLIYSTNPRVATSRPLNIAVTGTGLTGINNAVDADDGTAVANVGVSANINDGNLNTKVDTFNAAIGFSYAGIRFANPWPLKITRLELTLAMFTDGGWFGPNSVGPGAGNKLVSPTHLTVPSIQTTTDGTTWTTVPVASVKSDYIVKMAGQRIGGGGYPNPAKRTVSFTLLDPVANLRGVRIIGREGGTASGGFLGIWELAVQDNTSDNDRDHDGLTLAEETTLGTDPDNDDSDEDGVTDYAEVNTYHSNPLLKDTDGDKYPDGMELKYASNPSSATSFPTNLAILGTAIIGVNGVINETRGTPFFQAGSGNPVNMNDDDPLTRVDNYNGTGGVNSYLGYTWATPQTVKTLSITHATFGDGGWFGPNGLGPGVGGPLNATYLSEPVTQVSFDGGTTWATVDHTSDYLTVMNGHNVGGGAFPNPSSRTSVFTLTNAARGVTGFRVIGPEGGTASGGFIGCFEASVTSGGVPGDMDNDGLPDDWEVAKFGYVHAQHARGDTDMDGSDNLLEYALGLDPAAADFPAAPVLEGDYLTTTISKKPGVAYTVSSGSDIAAMSPADTTVITDSATTLKVRDNILFSEGPRRFMRTSVSPAP